MLNFWDTGVWSLNLLTLLMETVPTHPQISSYISAYISAYILPVIASWKCSLLFYVFLSAFYSQHVITPTVNCPSQLMGWALVSYLVRHRPPTSCCLPPQWRNLSLFHSHSPVSTTATLWAKILNLNLLAAHFPTLCQSARTVGETAPF